MTHQQPTPPENQAAQPQWVAVAPPPGSFMPGAPGTPGGNPPGRALAITAMALGLAALLTAVISALYFGYGAIIAGVLGLVAVVLGVVALSKQQRPRQAAIVGVASGVLSVVGAIVLGAMMLTGQMSPAGIGSDTLETSQESPDQSSDDSDQGGSEAQEDSDDEAESLLQWPSNMGTGGMLFIAGPDGPTAALSDPVAAGTAPTAQSVDRENGPADILLYVDYRCPHCVDFEAANVDKLEELVQSGAATLEIRPLSFVSPFSSSVANAMMCVIDTRPEDAWAAHVALMGKNTQVISTTTALSAAVDSALGGISGSLQDCIENENFSPLVSALSQWYLSSGVPNSVDPSLQVLGTPLAVVNGVAYTGNPADGDAFAAFLAEHGL